MSTDAVTALRQRMIEDMNARKALCGHAEGSYPRLQTVRCVSQALSRNGYGRGRAPVPVASGRGRLEHL